MAFEKIEDCPDDVGVLRRKRASQNQTGHRGTEDQLYLSDCP